MKLTHLFLLFVTVFLIYFVIGTHGTGKLGYDLDYYNPLARSFLAGRLDIPNPIETHDLSYFQGKWYPYWGPIPALLLMPFQIALGRYIPAGYLSLFFGSLNVVIVWLILNRVSVEYFKNQLKTVFKVLLLIFFALGTTHVYISGRSGVWFVSETTAMTSYLFAFYILIKKQLSLRDYFFASGLIGLNFLNRSSLVMLATFLFLRVIEDKKDFIKKLVVAGLPLAFFALTYMVYNYFRFGSPLDSGVNYMNIAPFDPAKVMPFGTFSWRYIPRNLWLMFAQLPSIAVSNGVPSIKWNFEGMSIFFVSPLYLAALLSLLRPSRLIWSLWLGAAALMVPIIFLFSPGLFQFGIRYSLDFSILLIVLAIFGLKGKANPLMIVAIIMAVILNVYATTII